MRKPAGTLRMQRLTPIMHILEHGMNLTVITPIEIL